MSGSARVRNTLADLLRIQIRRAIWWLLGAAIATFLGSLLIGPGVFLLTFFSAILWLGLTWDALVLAWQLKAFRSSTALILPLLLAAPGGLAASSAALYWSHVTPSAVTLFRHRAAFDVVTQGRSKHLPPGVYAISQDGRRLAFSVHNGMLGAWRAIVFDPTHRLDLATGWRGGSVAADIARLFDSETIWCQHITASYYHCHFD